MGPEWDAEVAGIFDPVHAESMRRWLRGNKTTLRYAHWSGQGLTSARLIAVYLTRTDFDGKAILKYVPSGRRETEEPQRHRTIWAGAPVPFREQHLVEPLGDAVVLPDGGWVLFQAVGRDDLSVCSTLSDLIRRDPVDGGVTERLVSIVAGLFEGWNGSARSAEFVPAGSYLRGELDFRMRPGGTVREWAVSCGLLDPRGNPIPSQVAGRLNPFDLVLDGVPASATPVRVRRGYGHRDLHPGNVLVTDDPSDFTFIDLSRAGGNEPLAADPAYLLLTTLAHHLPDLTSPRERTSLADLVLDPTRAGRHWVPGPLIELVTAVTAVGMTHGGRKGLRAEWRAEYLLALVTAALTMAGRAHLDGVSRTWFAELAARAAAAFAMGAGPAAVALGAATAPQRPARAHGSAVPKPSRRTEPFELPARLPYGVERSVSEVLADVIRRSAGSVTVLHGAPGTGKTQLAVGYAHDHVDEYTGIVWLSGDDPELLAERLADFATGVGLPPASDIGLLRRSVFTYLMSTGPWLYVLDGVPDAQRFWPFVPFMANVDVLITSRDSRWTRIGTRCAVGPFTETESRGLLTSLLGDVEGIGELAAALDHLPAAVDQAAHFLADSTLGCEEYRVLLGEATARVLAEGQPGLPSLGATWCIAMDRLAQTDPVATDLVVLACFLGPAPIPLDILAAVPASEYPALVEASGDPLRLDTVVKRAIGSGLVRTHVGAITLYPLFQAFVRDWVEDGGKPVSAVRSALGRCVPSDPGDPRDWPLFHRLLPHILAARFDQGDPTTAQPLLDAVRYLIARHDVDTALTHAEAILGAWTTAHGPDAEPTLAVKSHVAQARYHRGDHAVAFRLDHEVLVASRSVFGAESRAALVAARNAAASGSALSPRDAGQVPTWEVILARHREMFGPDHPDTLRSAHNRADELRKSGRAGAARELDTDTYRRMVSVQGERHVDSLRSGHALALDHRCLGDHEQALRLNRRVHGIRCEVLGDRHPETAQSAVSLAEDLRRRGEFGPAHELLEQAYPLLAESLGADDPLALLAAHGLVTLRNRLVTPDTELAEDTLARRRRVLGPAHLDTLRTQREFAAALFADGDTLRAQTERRSMAALLAAAHRRPATNSATPPGD